MKELLNILTNAHTLGISNDVLCSMQDKIMVTLTFKSAPHVNRLIIISSAILINKTNTFIDPVYNIGESNVDYTDHFYYRISFVSK